MWLKNLWRDIYRIRIPVVMIGLYWILSSRFFGVFCPLKIFCGVPCPACGMTRALLKILQGHWREAFTMNPMIYGWILMGGIWFLQRYLGKCRKIRLHILLIVVCSMTILLFGREMPKKFPDQEPYTYYEDNILARIR